MTKKLFKYLYSKKKFYLINIIFATIIFFSYFFVFKGIFSHEIVLKINRDIVVNNLRIVSVTKHFEKYLQFQIDNTLGDLIYNFDATKFLNTSKYFKTISKGENLESLKSHINRNKDYFVKDLSKDSYLSNFQQKAFMINYVVKTNNSLENDQINQIRNDIIIFLNNNSKAFTKTVIDFNIDYSRKFINDLDVQKKFIFEREFPIIENANNFLGIFNELKNNTYNLVEYCERNFLKGDTKGNVCYYSNENNKKKYESMLNNSLFTLKNANNTFNIAKKINFKLVNSIINYRDNFNENYFVADYRLINKYKKNYHNLFITQFSYLIKFLSFIVISMILHIIFYIYKFNDE